MMKKQFYWTIIAAVICINFNPSKASTAPSDYDLKKLRLQLDSQSIEKIQSAAPSIIVKKRLNRTDRYGVCHDYAFSRQLNIEGQIPQNFTMIGNTTWYNTFNILDHYTKVRIPEPGDIAVYRDCGQIAHTGIVYGEGLIESKWDDRPAIFIHPTWHVPSYYGNRVNYYRKIWPNEEIIQAIQQEIYYGTICQECKACNEWLIATSKNEQYNSNYFSRKTSQLLNYKGYSRDKKISMLLNWHLCANVNTTDYEQRTPLLLAAQSGDKKTVKTLIKYGADIDHQDVCGNTALHLASNKEIAHLLIKNGASLYAKNNRGQYAGHAHFVLCRSPFFHQTFINHYKKIINKIVE